MKIIDAQLLKQQIKSSEDFNSMAKQMASEVQEFYSSFEDSPDRRSAWGHHYFCKDDGNVLRYDPKDQHHHTCPICGKTYSSELFDGVWLYLYRNEAALAILKASILYKITGEKKYFGQALKIATFYITSFEKFELHNKEGLVFDSLETMKWGCGRIMPQSLNESIFFIRIFTGLELIKDELPQDLMNVIKNDFSKGFFKLLKPQINKIHNICCWMNSAIGVVGLFCGDKEMIDFAFDGEYNINRQLSEGVTEDGFWYEGSIHYNFFTLEGVSYLSLFAKAYEKEFKASKIIKKMFVSGYNYAFSSQQLPNPNDGWPHINLKSYSYIYSVGVKVFGYESQIGKILAQILSATYERGEVPLSKPYYYDNWLSLEQFLLLPDFDYHVKVIPNKRSMDFEKSNYALLKGDNIEVFYKYGHHGPSHAHLDKMTIEVMFGERALSRDLSNSGYGSVICNEWHRITASHNTVVVDGQNHTSFEPGMKMSFTDTSCDAKAEKVYEDVGFRRKVSIRQDGFQDDFEASSEKIRNYDFIFHVEAELDMDLNSICEILPDAVLGYHGNGYQYFENCVGIRPLHRENELTLRWKLGELGLVSKFDIKDTEVFLAKSPANPVTRWRTSILLRRKADKTVFRMNWKLLKSLSLSALR